MADQPTAAPTLDPYPADDYHLGPYKDLLAQEQAGTLDPAKADALTRGRQSGRFLLLDQALGAQASPVTPPVSSPAFMNAPLAIMDNPEQGAADIESFNPRAVPPSSATYRPYDVGLADRLGLVPLVRPGMRGANAPDLTGQGHLGGYVGSEFPDRLIASLQQLPRAIQEHPIATTLRVLQHLGQAPGDVLRSATEEQQGSNVAGAVGVPMDILSALATPPGRWAGNQLLNQLLQGGRAARGAYRLYQLLGQVEPPNPRGMPGAPPVNQGPLPPTGPQNPYYVPPGTTFH